MRADTIYVVDEGNNTVERYDADGTFLGVFATANLNQPSALAFSSGGNLFVANYGDNTIQQFDGTTGNYVGVFANTGPLPVAIAFAASGNLFVADIAKNITQYDGQTGLQVGSPFHNNFSYTAGLAASLSGNVFGAEFSQAVVLQLDGVSGAFVGNFAVTGLAQPLALAFASSGNLFVTNGDGNITEFEGSTGNFVGVFANTGSANNRGVAFASSGNLYVTDLGSQTVSQYNGTTGAFVGSFGSGQLVFPWGIAIRSSAPPNFTTQPGNQTVVLGGNATFLSAADGNATYQWQLKHGSGNFSNLTDDSTYSGVMTANLTVTNATATMDGDQLQVIATNGAGSNTSDVALLTVNSPPAFTLQPGNQTILVGGNATFTSAAGGNATFQWQLKHGSGNFGNLSESSTYVGVTTANLTVTNTTAGMSSDQFRVVASNLGGSNTSNIALLTANTPPAFTTQPANVTLTEPGTATFSILASGTVPLTYQWQVKHGTGDFANLTNTGSYGGTTTASLTVSNTSVAMSGDQFQVIVTGPGGSRTSDVVILTVKNAITIQTQPVGGDAVKDGDFTLTVKAKGPGVLVYQWKKDGVNLQLDPGRITGVKTEALTLHGVVQSDAGNYQVVITSGSSTLASAVVVVRVRAAVRVTKQPIDLTVKSGQDASFSVTVAGSTDSLTYQWLKNGKTLADKPGHISGTTTAKLVISGAKEADGAFYSVLVTNSVSTATSDKARLIIE